VVVRRRRERVDDILRRPNLGIPAPEVDERLSLERGRLRNPRQQRGEVLLRKPAEAVWPPAHRAILPPRRNAPCSTAEGRPKAAL
jgi:hypothetical protein